MDATAPRPIVVAATTNEGKLRELRRLLADTGVEVRSLADVPDAPAVVEDGATFAANARKKALACARHCGLPALADDSGLEVDALGGAPGVRSARYAGEDADDAANVAKLLAAMRDVAAPDRRARFRCAIVLALPTGATVLGSCEGRITCEPRGEGGFGYDPVFLYEPEGKTFAELAPDTKNRVSHRARALAALQPEVRALLAAHVTR